MQINPKPKITMIESMAAAKPSKLPEPIKKRAPVPEGTFTRYLDAWRYKRDTGCKREIKKTGYNEYKV